MKLYIEVFPNAWKVYDSLEEAYENKDQLAEAVKNYAKAVKIAEKEDHAFLQTYKDNLTRIKTTLAEK